MTRFEYLQLRGMLEASTQKKIMASKMSSYGTFLFIFLAVIFTMVAGPFLGEKTPESFKLMPLAIMLFVGALFLFEDLKRVTLEKKNLSLFVTLDNAWKSGKSVEETLALPEFENFFPKKSSLPPGPIGFETAL